MKLSIQKIKQLVKKDNIKELYSKYEPYWSPVALIFGFVVDNLTLRRIDLWAENIVIIIYLSLTLGIILFITAYESACLPGNRLNRLARFSPYVLQFLFGGIFSVFLVFYIRSASFLASWPFLIILAGVLIGNELFRKRYQRLTFRLSIYFIALFSYSVFAVPIIFKKLGTPMFLISGAVSIVLIILVVLLAKK